MKTELQLLPLREAQTIAIDAAKHHGELAFLYVKVDVQSKGIGQAIWKAMSSVSILDESQKRMK